MTAWATFGAPMADETGALERADRTVSLGVLERQPQATHPRAPVAALSPAWNELSGRLRGGVLTPARKHA